MRLLICCFIITLAVGCNVRPNTQFTGEHPSYEHTVKGFPNLIPAISKAGQNRGAVNDIVVLWNDELPSPEHYTFVGMITSTHNPPADINDQMIMFSKLIGLNAIVLQPPGKVRVLGVPTRVYGASVFIKN